MRDQLEQTIEKRFNAALKWILGISFSLVLTMSIYYIGSVNSKLEKIGHDVTDIKVDIATVKKGVEFNQKQIDNFKVNEENSNRINRYSKECSL